MKPIIELTRDDLQGYNSNFYPDVKFLGEQLPNDQELVKLMNEIYYGMGEQERTHQQMLNNMLDTQEKKELFEYFSDDFHDVDDYENYNEWINDYYYEAFEYLFYRNKENMIRLIESNDLQYGTAGYSPWSHYIAHKDMDTTYIKDLYDGYNFYIVSVVELDNENMFEDYSDSIGFVYIRDTSELKSFVQDNFLITDFLLVDNPEATYFNVPKIQEQTHVTKSYKIIERTD